MHSSNGAILKYCPQFMGLFLNIALIWLGHPYGNYNQSLQKTTLKLSIFIEYTVFLNLCYNSSCNVCEIKYIQGYTVLTM